MNLRHFFDPCIKMLYQPWMMSLIGPFYFISLSFFPTYAFAFYFQKHASNHKLMMSGGGASNNNNKDVLEKSRFLNFEIASKIKSKHELPVYVYSEKELRTQAQNALNFPNAYGLTVRFAMKACPNAAILQLFNNMGINFDASSGYEVQRALKAGVDPKSISLSSQEFPSTAMFSSLYTQGLEFNACSLKQLEEFGKLFPGGKCGVRFNPGQGSGGTGKTVSDIAFISKQNHFFILIFISI